MITSTVARRAGVVTDEPGRAATLKEMTMSATEVTHVLEQWAQRLRDLGARGVSQLRPGLSSDQIDALSAQYDLTLPEDARAIWAWHDGEDTGAQSLAPYREFPPLREALEYARTCAQNAIDWGAADDEELAAIIYRREFVPFLGYQHPLVFDCRTPAPTTTMWTPDGGLEETISMTTVERVRWWHWALDHGAWSITADGTWAVDFSRYPGAKGDLSVRDVLS
jgi:hypothetical protein